MPDIRLSPRKGMMKMPFGGLFIKKATGSDTGGFERMEVGKVELSGEMMTLIRENPKLLSPVYEEICEKLGPEAALELHSLFRGQQIHFPVRLLGGPGLRQAILRQYDGTNLKSLGARYGYSEKTLRRFLKKR